MIGNQTSSLPIQIRENSLKIKELLGVETYPVLEDDAMSYRSVLENKRELIWRKLSSITVEEAKEEWLSTVRNPHTRISYNTAMNELLERAFLIPHWSLQEFSLISPEMIIDKIKLDTIFIKDKSGKASSIQWSIRTREARISCFLSFTRYLCRKTEGLIRRGVPSKEGIERTFSPKPRKVKKNAMNRSQLIRFFEELDRINPRDAMIARVCLHGAKRISEVLSLKTEQIDYDKRQIIFKQSKSRIFEDFTIISFEKGSAMLLFEELKRYIGNRKGLVFVTANGKEIKKTQLDRTFSKAGKRGEISFRISPHNLRATAVTLWKEDGFSDSMIMHATGHASSEMVNCYDKSDMANNVTKKSCLF
jgi:integrase/recombinase XerD